ncbi:hypothetical protein PCC7424_4488 [Gloeothece citriformis PCC 7424]|uniref:Uncharacterized protein n=1 Tax=Gloeothece citriformis (strain PCC 7424) TaxID=65393 RepID=B7KA78_GLOC7|nr:hypothetical protein PCC7424_4488 [Gloeothece citriformis PCC 7424]
MLRNVTKIFRVFKDLRKHKGLTPIFVTQLYMNSVSQE